MQVQRPKIDLHKLKNKLKNGSGDIAGKWGKMD